MNEQNTNILETFTMPHGFDIDVDEGWRKLIARQFGGSPGRGFSELIQNFLDSYPSETTWENRKAKIDTGAKSIAITDWGEGMSRDRLRLLITMGGTDKHLDDSKIGTFGIGFFSIFNPKLSTRKVTVTTGCEGRGVELIFDVHEPEQRPELKARLLEAPPDFGTKVQVDFKDERSPQKCIDYARKSLKFYPCAVTINGTLFESAWKSARDEKAEFFKQSTVEGFVRTSRFGPWVRVLCKYEHILEGRPGFLATGGRRMKRDLRDYQNRGVPFVPHVEMVINSNALHVTISRDGLMMNGAYFSMVDVMVETFEGILIRELGRIADSEREYTSLVIANQFTMAEKLSAYIDRKLSKNRQTHRIQSIETQAERRRARLLKELAEAKVHRLSGRKGRFSLMDLVQMKSSDLPLFYAPQQHNLRWLGGDFLHDFVVIPPFCTLGGGAPELHDLIFRKIFHNDVVNLDSIDGDQEAISALVERGVVSPDSLKPDAKAVNSMELEQEERALQEEINGLLRHEAVLDAVRRNLFLEAAGIEATFYKIESEKMDVASGLFGTDGEVVAETDQGIDVGSTGKIFIGMRRGHPFVEHLKESKNPHRAYFALTFLAHELAGSQKALVPHTPYSHFVKNSLSHDMRRGLLASITSQA